LGALGSVLAARLVRRHGLVGPVVAMRGIGLALLVAVPLVPAFAPAALLYAVRAGFNQGTAGARQALAVGLTRERRGLAASLQNVSIQLPRAVGPLLAGFMLHAGMLRAPFFVAALLQGAYLVLYVRFFRDHADGDFASVRTVGRNTKKAPGAHRSRRAPVGRAERPRRGAQRLAERHHAL
ncbi:MAG TPA: MFS transporter, partial [Rubrivivax sp.]|nr:MFS transporter [Rubrivivax sp.]